MHLEFSHFLQRALGHADILGQELLGKDKPTTQALAALIHEITFDVSNCLPQIGADISTNIAFQVSAKIREQLHISRDPLSIAEYLLQVLKDLGCLSYFTVVTAGLGYLNATPTPLFINTFWAKLSENGVSLLLSQNPLVVSEQPTHRENETSLEMKIDWNRLLTQNHTKASNPDIARLLNECKSKQTSTSDDVLMLFALLGNSELEIEPYLLGLGGSQNVPWYIRRYVVDANNFAKHCRYQLEKRFMHQLSDHVPISLSKYQVMVGISQLPQLLTTNMKQVLSFRQLLPENHQARRPVIFLQHLLKIIKGFYIFYHHPQGREFPTKAESFESLALLVNIIEICRNLVEKGVFLIDVSCTSRIFGLQQYTQHRNGEKLTANGRLRVNAN